MRGTRTDTQVCVDARVTSSPSETVVLTIWNMGVRLRVSVLLGQTKIDNIDLIPSLAHAHQEIVGFYITVNKGFGVDVFDPGDQLVG